MKILALDFSSPQRSVAVGGHDAPPCEVVDSSLGRDMKPFALIEAALEMAGLRREAIECIAVGVGPGSYTGIRVAISVAQGWQLATGVKLLGISSAETIAAQAVAERVGAQFSVVIDAQRGEFYLADYEVAEGRANEVRPLRLATLVEVQARGHEGATLVGPEVTRWFPVGQLVFPSAATMVKLAIGREDYVLGEKLEPIYLRETTFVKAPPARVIPE